MGFFFKNGVQIMPMQYGHNPSTIHLRILPPLKNFESKFMLTTCLNFRKHQKQISSEIPLEGAVSKKDQHQQEHLF